MLNFKISDPVSLTVLRQPSGQVGIGDVVDIICNVMTNEVAMANYGIKFIIVWKQQPRYSDSVILTPNHYISISEDRISHGQYTSNLTINSLQFSDSGSYTCSATISSAEGLFITKQLSSIDIQLGKCDSMVN